MAHTWPRKKTLDFGGSPDQNFFNGILSTLSQSDVWVLLSELNVHARLLATTRCKLYDVHIMNKVSRGLRSHTSVLVMPPPHSWGIKR